MVIAFTIAFLLEWIAAFVVSATFKFKEEYKKYHDRIFESNNVTRPLNWGISRQKNHDRFVVFRCLAVILLLLAVAFGSCIDNLVVLFVLTFAIPILLPLPLGASFGKYLCRRAVKKECKKFGINFE